MQEANKMNLTSAEGEPYEIVWKMILVLILQLHDSVGLLQGNNFAGELRKSQ